MNFQQSNPSLGLTKAGSSGPGHLFFAMLKNRLICETNESRPGRFKYQFVNFSKATPRGLKNDFH